MLHETLDMQNSKATLCNKSREDVTSTEFYTIDRYMFEHE